MLTLAAWLIVLGPLLALGWFCLELLCGLTPLGSGAGGAGPDARSHGADQAVVIMVPAHDEALSIADTVKALSAELGPDDRILVVADNCQDATAAIARNAGAQVIERHDRSRRGKGYALAFGRDHLAAGSPPAVVVIVDADCRLKPGSVDALSSAVLATGRPVQAVDILQPDLALPPMAQISGFAFLVKNLVRLRGLSRLGGCCLLCGTGMAFAWRDFATANLATGDVVEDLRLAVELIGNGRRPMLIETACVTSPAAAVSASIAQRDRWERGFVGTATRQALPALMRGIARGDRAGVALGLHLLVPPLALLLMLASGALAIAIALALLGGSAAPAAVVGALMMIACAGLAVAWAREGRETLRAAALARAPVYVLWKLPIYLRLIGGKAAGWHRTRRG